MQPARTIGLAFVVLCTTAAPVPAGSATSSIQGDGARAAPDSSGQRERIERAIAARKAGDYATARTIVAEVVTSLLARSEAEGDASWLALLSDAGTAAWNAQDARTAHRAWTRVLEVRSKTLPAEHPDLLKVQQDLGATMNSLGDLAGARAMLEKVLEVYSRTLPDDDPNVLRVQQNLGGTLYSLGDVARAHALYERVLEIRSRTLPDDHRAVLMARQNLAATMYALGNTTGARALEEQVLEVRARTLPDDHPDLQRSRGNLAATMFSLGELEDARSLQEKVLEVRARTLPDEHPDLQMSRGNLALTKSSLGDLAGARELQEKVLEVDTRTRPDDHPALQHARLNLAKTIGALGDPAGARALQEKVLEVRTRTLLDDHPDLQIARQNVAATIALQIASTARSPGNALEGREGERAARERCVELMSDLCSAQVHSARAAILTSPSREAEERCANLGATLDMALSFAQGFGVFEQPQALVTPSFVLSETTRGAAIASTALSRAAAGSPKYSELRAAVRAASDELAALARRGTTSEEFDRARKKRESAEREIVALARELSGGSESGATLDPETLSARLGERAAAVGFRRYKFSRLRVEIERESGSRPKVKDVSAQSLCAFVVRAARSGSAPSSTITLVDLGPIAPIEDAVRAWREPLGVSRDSRGVGVNEHRGADSQIRERGVALRERILDPLLPALAGIERLMVVLDDVLHVVPFEALPIDDELVGDRWRVEIRTTLGELLEPLDSIAGTGSLVALGNVEYQAERAASEVEATATLGAASVQHALRTDRGAGILRGTEWSTGFAPLPSTAVEVRGIAKRFVERFGEDGKQRLLVLETHEASRERLQERSPHARYLHIATHGWFAPESIRSWSDPEPLDKHTGLGTRTSSEAQVKGMSPMLLCGLALAGANMSVDAVGRVPGLVTADELSALDLTNCELVVLSACDTNVGERRAGQGVASLQKALQMAGARSVITSLWKVPDEATKDLMLDFYRRLWVRNEPKWQALWEAKRVMRDAKDERGQPKYTTRDWAAWVLTGDPD